MLYFKKFILWFIFFGIGLLAYNVLNMAGKKSVMEKRIEVLPDFNFNTLKKARFTNDSLLKNKSTMVFFFNTNCEHCHYEIEQIVQHANEFEQINLLMVSVQSVRELEKFDSSYGISTYPFITILQDVDNVMLQTFDVNNVPAIFIYNEKNRLLKKYSGEVKIEAIIDAIK